MLGLQFFFYLCIFFFDKSPTIRLIELTKIYISLTISN